MECSQHSSHSKKKRLLAFPLNHVFVSYISTAASYVVLECPRVSLFFLYPMHVSEYRITLLGHEYSDPVRKWRTEIFLLSRLLSAQKCHNCILLINSSFTIFSHYTGPCIISVVFIMPLIHLH